MYLEYRMCSLNQLTAEVKIQLDVIQNLMIGPNSNSGTDLSNLCQVWHDQMYERMFQSGKVGIYSMSDYLRDFDDRLALIFCHFRAAVLLLTAGAGGLYLLFNSPD